MDLTDDELEANLSKISKVEQKTLEEKYSMGEELGRGRFSTVFEGVALDGTKVAIKEVENEALIGREEWDAFELEIRILKMVNHPNIVQLVEVILCPGKTYIIMELLAGGELFSRLVEMGTFSEEEAKPVFCQVVLAIEHMHNQNIVWRDLKPENIIFMQESTDALKIIDFGYAGLATKDGGLVGLTGTPDYVAPEVVSWYFASEEDGEEGQIYGKECDMWSLGVLLYVLLSGCSPFPEEEEEDLLKQVLSGDYSFPLEEWSSISPHAKDLIRNLLVVDPKKRLDIHQIQAHSWLKATLQQHKKDVKTQSTSKGSDRRAPQTNLKLDGDQKQNCCALQ